MSFDLGIKHLFVCEAAGDVLINWPHLIIRLVSPDSLCLVNPAQSYLLLDNAMHSMFWSLGIDEVFKIH